MARLAAFLDCSAVVAALVSNLLSGTLLVHSALLYPLLEDLKRGSSCCSPAISQTRKESLKTAKVLLVEVGWLLLVWLTLSYPLPPGSGWWDTCEHPLCCPGGRMSC